MVGCASLGLRVDTNGSAIDSHYHSAEIVVNGDHNLGIAAARADVGQPFSFSVAGIYRGTITVKSKECGVDISRSYSETGLVPFTVSVKDRCLFSISVFPDFSEDESNKIEWRGLSGVLAVRSSRKAFVKSERIRFISNALLEIDFEERTRVYLSGCGFKHHLIHPAGLFSIDVKDNLNPEGGECVVDGYAMGSSGTKTDLALLISHYDIGFNRLPIPELKVNRRSIAVVADSSVSFMAFNEQQVFSNNHRFSGTKGTLRLYTSQGRYAFCVIDGGVQCYR